MTWKENPTKGKETGYSVFLEGSNPLCEHKSFKRRVYTSSPPVYGVICDWCGRELRKRMEEPKQIWPE